VKDDSTLFGRPLGEIKKELRRNMPGAGIVRDERLGSLSMLSRGHHSDVQFGGSTGPEPEASGLIEALYQVLEAAQEPILEELHRKLGGYLATEQSSEVTINIDPNTNRVKISF
jgi:hypothetical protein